MTAPLFSVIMPTFNSGRFITFAIRSVTQQTCDDWELIVVDGGSTDNTLLAVSWFGDKRIRVVRQQGYGIADARNTGVREANGKYVAFLDSDDMWMPPKLEVCAEVAPFTCHSVYRLDWSGVFSSGTIEAPKSPKNAVEILHENPCVCSSVVVRRDYLKATGEFRGAGCEDWDMWIRVAKLEPVTPINPVLGYWRTSPESMSSDLTKMDTDRLAVIDRACDEMGMSKRQKRRLVKRHHEKMIRMFFGQRDWNSAEEAFNAITMHGIPSFGAIWRMLVSVVKWGTA